MVSLNQSSSKSTSGLYLVLWRTRGIPVMVGTCKSLSDESKSKVKLLGIKDYIIKPFHLETLSEKVRYILDNEKRKS